MRIGDIVRLNSGSPELKVISIDSTQIEVEWVHEGGEPERMTRPTICFRLVNSN